MRAASADDELRALRAEVERLRREHSRPDALAQAQQRLLERLEELLRQVTLQSAQGMQQLQEAAGLAQLRKERVTTTVHDLKVPITICLLHLELAESDPEPALKGVHLNSARRELEFLLDTIGNLLDLERGNTHRDTLRLEEVSLHELVTKVLDRMRVLIADKPELALSNTVPKNLPPLRCDKHRMSRVFANLLSNSIKYTDVGAITVSAERTDAGRLHILVRDTGVGMSEARRQQLFQFFQGDPEQYDSSGIGLMYVRRTVEAHGGRVWVESQVGAGTVVGIELEG